MKILVLNSGSSSIKFQVLEMPNETLIASGMIDRIGSDKSVIKITSSQTKVEKNILITNHEEGVKAIIDTIQNPQYTIISDIHDIKGVGHRIVHGGEKFSKSVIITPEILTDLESCNDLAPLHNPANIKGVRATQTLLPHAQQCGTLDTAFHQTMPDYAYMYAIPYKYYSQYKVRKYGFHGSSHRYVSHMAALTAKKDYNQSKIIVCHLGNGASISAIQNGKSIDTTMGLTPLEGLMMGTRCGDLDLGAALHIMRKEQISIDEFDTILNKQSGLVGITGFSSDMRDIKEAANNGNKRAQLALDMFTYRVKKYIGAYAAAMEGVDIIAFTGGIGENNSDLRESLCNSLSFLGISIDNNKNNNITDDNAIITTPDSAITTMVIKTNEEIVIARDTYALIQS
ncbi:MAG: acetate kinase [Bacteroidales bacterium]